MLQLMLLAAAFCVAQPQPQTYEPVKPSGEIPKDMIIKSSKKYEIEKSTISKDESKKDRKTKESFYLSTNFEIDKLLLSGQVSFNDPITTYLNKIVDVLLKDEPELRKQIRVYTMKSTSMNAFATNQGIIFVNLGLLARLKNEAELAFILAHEITHVEEKHSLNKYLKVQTVKQGKNIYKDLSLDDKLATVNHYSRELETEADEHGLERYLKAGYSLDAIEGSFTALSYAHMPFVEYEFNYKWLESNTFIFPREFGREKINTPKPLEDDDTTSTHPSIQQRKANILAKVKDTNADGRKVYWVSETDFAAAKEFAQFEVCRLHLARQRYDLAIYEAQALQQQYPNNLFLKKVIMHAMASMAYYSHDGINMNEWEDYVNEELQGNVQRTYHFHLSLSIDPDYIASVATRYSWQLRMQYPNDKEIQTVSDSLMHLLFASRQVKPDFFSMAPRPQREVDSIAFEYDYLEQPYKIKAEQDYKDSLKNARLGTNVSSNNDTTGDVGITTKTVYNANSSTTANSQSNTEPTDVATEENSEDDEYEQEDEVLITSVEDAKRQGIKLTGYQKYQLKNKEKYDIKGFRIDGTVVYNDSNSSESPNREEAPSRNTDQKRSTAEETSKADTSTVVEKVYYHEFKKPLDPEFHKYAFVDFANDPTFLKKAKQYYKKGQDADNNVVSKTERKKKEREKELNQTRGYALDIKKVVVVNPRYSKINLVNTNKQQYLTSEKNQQKFSKTLKRGAETSGIKFEVIDNQDLKNNDVNKFNDIAFLNEWLDERLELGTTVPLSTMSLEQRQALAQKYGTNYFMWTGNLSVKEKDYMKTIWIVYSSIFPPLLPFTLPKMIRAGKYQIYYYIVFDIINNTAVLSDVVVSNQLERNDFVNSQTFYTFHQLKYKR